MVGKLQTVFRGLALAVALVLVLIVVIIASPSGFVSPPFFYNDTPSLPRGFYHAEKTDTLAVGDVVRPGVDGLQGRSIICAPLLTADGNAAGIVQLDSVDDRHPFDHCDLEILAAVTRLVTLAMEYAHLHDRVVQQKVTEIDLATAHRVQEKLLPRRSPAHQ